MKTSLVSRNEGKKWLKIFFKNAVADGKHAYLKYDKLVINDQVYEYNNETGDIAQIDK